MKTIPIYLNESQWATVQKELHFAAAHHAANSLPGDSGGGVGMGNAPEWRMKRIEFVREKISEQLRAARPVEERDRA